MTETTNTLELLKRVDIFQGVPETALEELLATAKTVGVEKGDVLFHEGDAGDAMYLVVVGAIELIKPTRGGEGQRLALLDRGQIFGELSLFDELPRSATATAFVKSTLLAFSGAAFATLLDEQQALAPHLLRNLVKKLSLRLRDADEEIRELGRQKV